MTYEDMITRGFDDDFPFEKHCLDWVSHWTLLWKLFLAPYVDSEIDQWYPCFPQVFQVPLDHRVLTRLSKGSQGSLVLRVLLV